MKLFGQFVRTVVNVATLPVAMAKDVVTLGGAMTGEPSATVESLERLRRESDEDDDE